MPKFLAEAPELLPGLALYYEAYSELRTGQEPISWLAIDRYCQVHGIIGETRDLMFHYLRQMDNAMAKSKK